MKRILKGIRHPRQAIRIFLRKLHLIPRSRMAIKYLKGKSGIEIGAGGVDFGLGSVNVDLVNDFYEAKNKKQGRNRVDVFASGDNLPFADNTYDYVFNSHVLEHFFDPIKAIKEWVRVIKPGGYVFMIIPHKERTFDKDRPRTPLAELIDRHAGKIKQTDTNIYTHHSVWITEDLLELCEYLNLKVVDYKDKDDAAGNGFIIVIQKAAE